MFSFLIFSQQAGGAPAQGNSPFSFVYMMIIMVGIIYLMMIRPQQKKAKQHQEWLKSLKKGDEVVTQGGIVGRISGMTDQIVTLEVQEKVRLRVLRSSITGKPPEIKRAQPAVEEKIIPAEEKK